MAARAKGDSLQRGQEGGQTQRQPSGRSRAAAVHPPAESSKVPPNQAAGRVVVQARWAERESRGGQGRVLEGPRGERPAEKLRRRAARGPPKPASSTSPQAAKRGRSAKRLVKGQVA